MSTWTHVVGIIRVDNLLMGDDEVEEIRRIIGPTNLWEEDNAGCKLPEGSEGSLHYEIIEYSTGLHWIAIPIWGDLRDFEDLNSIRVWWNDLLKEIQDNRAGIIRDGILQAQCRNTRLICKHKEDIAGNEDNDFTYIE